MTIAYLAALIVGLGTILLQLVLSSGDANGADTDTHVGQLELHADVNGDADTDAGADADTHAEAEAALAGFFALFLSLRFWIFSSLAFGLTGTLMTWLHVAGPVTTFVLSIVMGLGSGLLAAWVVHALGRSALGSGASSEDAVGKVGRVILPCARDRIGKVRIELRGQSLDLLAKTDEEDLPVGAHVLVEAVSEDHVVVCQAPQELVLPDE